MNRIGNIEYQLLLQQLLDSILLLIVIQPDYLAKHHNNHILLSLFKYVVDKTIVKKEVIRKNAVYIFIYYNRIFVYFNI